MTVHMLAVWAAPCRRNAYLCPGAATEGSMELTNSVQRPVSEVFAAWSELDRIPDWYKDSLVNPSGFPGGSIP